MVLFYTPTIFCFYKINIELDFHFTWQDIEPYFYILGSLLPVELGGLLVLLLRLQVNITKDTTNHNSKPEGYN